MIIIDIHALIDVTMHILQTVIPIDMRFKGTRPQNLAIEVGEPKTI